MNNEKPDQYENITLEIPKREYASILAYAAEHDLPVDYAIRKLICNGLDSLTIEGAMELHKALVKIWLESPPTTKKSISN